MGQLILKQFGRTRAIIAQTIEGMEPASFEVIPEGFNNNIHWQLGHILVVGELFLFANDNKLPANYNALFGNGSKPADWTEDVPSVETIVEQLKEQAVRIQAIDVATFDVKLPEKFLGNETVGELASMGAFHEAYHLGQIHTMKRLV